MKVSILGSTGSIGTQALQVIEDLKGIKDIEVVGISGNRNITLLEEQIRKFKPKYAATFDEASAKQLQIGVADTDCKVLSGQEGLCAVSAESGADMVLSSIVGFAGLVPTMRAIEEGIDIALANKETLVTAGSLFMEAIEKNKVRLLPVDSEHCAIFQSLQSGKPWELRKILLTASGGPFFGKTKEQLKDITKSDALKHPNWAMGAKITIDSATLMNKGLEVIEAKWLFGVEPDDIDVYVHRQSIVHSMIEFEDRSVIAQMGIPDMKLPIVYAMRYPERSIPVHERLDLYKVKNLTFDKPDPDTFDCLKIAFEAIKKGGSAPTVMNAANEVAVEKFLNDEIKFLDIPVLIRKTIDAHDFKADITLDDVLKLDSWARMYARETVI